MLYFKGIKHTFMPHFADQKRLFFALLLQLRRALCVLSEQL